MVFVASLFDSFRTSALDVKLHRHCSAFAVIFAVDYTMIFQQMTVNCLILSSGINCAGFNLLH